MYIQFINEINGVRVRFTPNKQVEQDIDDLFFTAAQQVVMDFRLSFLKVQLDRLALQRRGKWNEDGRRFPA